MSARVTRGGWTRACRRLLLLTLAIVIPSVLLVPTTHADDEPAFVVAVHVDNPIRSIGMRDLRLMYSGTRSRWPGFMKVFLILPEKDSSAMKFVARRIFRKRSSNDVARFYAAALFSQKLSLMPARLEAEKALQKVSAMRGAVAIVPFDSVINRAGIRTFPIE